jgi:DNA polymerase (family X)
MAAGRHRARRAARRRGGTARKLQQALAPASLEARAAMCRAGAIPRLPGFGKASEGKILRAIEERHDRPDSILLVDAEERAAALADHLRAGEAITALEIGGLVRRFVETVDQVAYAVATSSRDAVIDRLAAS